MKKLLILVLSGFCLGFISALIVILITNIFVIWYYWLLMPLGLGCIGALIGWTIYLMTLNLAKKQLPNKTQGKKSRKK